MVDNLLKRLGEKKEQFRRLLKAKPANFQEQLDEWIRVELTYASNNIEGNTLTRQETAEVIERGVGAVIGRKSLKDQLEALNHARAIDLTLQLAVQLKGHQFIEEEHVKSIHRTILAGIDDYNAGNYRQTEVFIRGVSDVILPQPYQVPIKMRQLIEWLEGQQATHPVQVAAEAHFRFVSIHPFIDGNGRTGRLLMNLVLLLNGYPLTVIRAEERQEYLESLHTLQIRNDGTDYYGLVYKAVERSLDAYLNLAQGKPALTLFGEIGRVAAGQKLLKIGQVAGAAKVSIPTVRYYVDQGLIRPVSKTAGGFMLLEPQVVKTIGEIKRLQQEERLLLSEIKLKLKQV